MNPEANHELCVAMMCQHGFINSTNVPSLMGEVDKGRGLPFASLAETFLDYSVIFHEGAGFGNMSDLTGALLASAQLLPYLS